jgi:hypothetical protein
MQEEFVKALFISIVSENLRIYHNLFDTTKVGSKTDEYWKNALQLYNGFSAKQKDIFMSVIRQTMIDTISNFLGIIDGNSTLNNFGSELKLEVEKMDISGELQDQFLAMIENLEDNN